MSMRCVSGHLADMVGERMAILHTIYLRTLLGTSTALNDAIKASMDRVSRCRIGRKAT